MLQQWTSSSALALVAAVGLLGCAQGADIASEGDAFEDNTLQDNTLEEQLGTAQQAILDGAAATHHKFGAVGALVYTFPELGVVDVFCSATLVARDAVVTARHCGPSIDLAPELGLTAAFAIGPDAFAPTELIPITGYVAAPAARGHEKGLLQDGGRDVAVAYLESAATTVVPAKLGLFDKHMLGDKFQIAGYGVSDAFGTYGQRFAGLGTARAIKGRWYELLFRGNYHAYLNWYFSDSPSAQPSEAEAKEWWKTFRLESNYELLAGGLRGEAVACYGDSGGPLLRGTKASNMTVYGVSFAVEGSVANICGLGGGYLVFNHKMLDFVQDAL
jgi:hypothetical protein